MESLPGDLLEHADWVRRLARRLVRDAAAADDVVQETWLAALKARRASEAPLRPWLARVAANFAREGARGDANRSAHERASARPERQPSAAETAERLEAQRLLVEALAALDEPYRTTVTLRYLDGLSAAAIARRSGVPAGTVRWRLKHGMDELRERLDARARGRGDRAPGAWCLLLLPLLRRPPLVETAVAMPSAALQGVLAMNALTKLGIAAAIVVTASVGVWIAVDRSGAPPALAAPAADAPVPPLAAERPTEPSSSLVPSTAEEVRQPALLTVSIDESAPPPGTAVSRLEARFLDTAGRPIAGVALALDALKEVRGRPSDTEGRIVLDLDDAIGASIEPRSSPFRATRAGYATGFGQVLLQPGRTTYIGDVTLEPGGSIAGRVLGFDGAPAADAPVLVTQPGIEPTTLESRLRGPGDGSRVPQTTTAADGTFRIDDIRVGRARAWASAPHARWSASAVLDVTAGAVLGDVELRLEPLVLEDTIEGRVLSPDGEPVARAAIRYKGTDGRNQSTYSEEFSADSEGRFVHRLPLRGTHDLTARDRKGRWTDVAALGVASGTRDLVLQFPASRFVELSVRGVASAPIPEFSVRALSADRSRILLPGELAQHEGGRARILVPAEPFLLEVRARGHGSAELGPYEPAAAPESLSCTLDRRGGVRGRVTAAGQPVANARVALYEMCDDRTEIKANGFPTRLHPEPEDQARTDADGRYELDPTRPGSAEGQRFFQRDPGTPGTFAILCDADGHALAEVSPLEIDPIVGLDGVDVALGPGGSIEGQVLVARGKDAAGTVVAIDRTDGRARTQRVGLDGRFRFDRLAPGRWNVVRTEEEIHSGSRSASWSHGDEPVTPKLPWNCTVTEGETTRFDLDLTDDRPCALHARVLVGNAPAAGWSIALFPERGATARAHPSDIVDNAGDARLEAEEPGSFGLHLAPPAGSESRFSVPLVLARGDNSHTLRIEVGTVRGRVLAPSAGASIQMHGVSTSTEGLAFGARVVPDANGRFEIPFVLAGRTHLSLVQDSADGGAEPIAKKVLEVPAGGSVEVELP